MIQRFALISLLFVVLLVTGCASTPPSDNSLIRESRTALDSFVDRDPELQRWIDHAQGYAVFPDIG
ncbi:MAG: hypothetical protein AAGJ52_02450, partial [Pseudomonadota bacterium]